MDKAQAIRLVKDTLDNSFNKDNFLYLAKNLLKEIEETPQTIYRGSYIPDVYKDYINIMDRMGKYEGPDGKKIDVITVNLKKETSLERARTMQRNFIAWFLNGSRGGTLKDAALVAFVSPNEDDWRFSFVKMEYKFIETKKGNIKAKEEFTPAKRHSFLVGNNENSHTAQSRLVPQLTKGDQRPTLEEIEDIFSVEKATKEFFDKYRDLYLRTKELLDKIVSKDKKVRDDFEGKGVNTVDFSKKLLGQIVFLYFLQRKGWFGVSLDKKWGEGDKKFLRTLFDKAKTAGKNYFNDYLEPLFYEALANPDRDHDYYSRFDCRIPFLNGGLFDPINNYDWVNTVINFQNELFANNKTTKEGDKGDGILDVFDRFNFTVKEDEPLEKEVAVDPEMLGKVFENLLEVKDRKSKGTYYTPREIVHYMCVQSLVNYLATELTPSSHGGEGGGEGGKPLPTKDDIEKLVKYGELVGENEARVEEKGEETERYYYKLPGSIRENAKLIDDKLADIKVCDPAIGSGAFPVGMMTEIVRTRNVLTSYISPSRGEGRGEGEARTTYNFKRHCIHNSLYGVDIDPGAIEIAKLRLWLSLIVDEDDIKKIKPLPNLDYKIMQGNSLLEEYEGIKLFDDKFITGSVSDRESQVKELKARQNKLSSEYIRLHNTDKLSKAKQTEIKTELEKIVKRISKLNKSEPKKTSIELFDSISEAKKKADKLKQLHEAFFDTIHKNDKDSIKREIEFLEWELIEATFKEQNKLSELKKLEDFKKSNTKPFFLWKLHFAEVFQKRGGFDVVIANPPYVKEYVNRAAFDGLRNSPYYQGKMDLWYLFACRGIDVSRKASGVVTFIAQNNWVTSHGASKMRNKVISDAQILSLIDFGDFKIFEAGIQTMVMLFRTNTGLDNYTFDYRRLQGKNLEFNNVIGLLNKENNPRAEYLTPKITRRKFIGKMLTFSSSDVQQVLEKISFRANFHLTHKEVANGIHHHHDRVNKKRMEILGGHFRVGDGIFVLNNKEKERIPFTKKELSLIKPSYTTKKLYRWYGNPVNQEWVIYTDSSFKNKKKIKDYPNIKKHLDPLRKVITSDNKPYGLHRARDEYFFKGEKIIAVRKCARPTFTYVDFDSYVSATFYVIKTERANQKYLTGVLNSKLMTFWLKNKGKMQGTNFQIDKEPILALPLLQADHTGQSAIADIVLKIFAVIKDDDYLKNSTKQAKVREYEKQIDQLVYELYELTDDEIAIVEKVTKDK